MPLQSPRLARPAKTDKLSLCAGNSPRGKHHKIECGYFTFSASEFRIRGVGWATVQRLAFAESGFLVVVACGKAGHHHHSDGKDRCIPVEVIEEISNAGSRRLDDGVPVLWEFSNSQNSQLGMLHLVPTRLAITQELAVAKRGNVGQFRTLYLMCA